MPARRADFIFVVMEYAEQTLAQILPNRPLTSTKCGNCCSRPWTPWPFYIARTWCTAS